MPRHYQQEAANKRWEEARAWLDAGNPDLKSGFLDNLSGSLSNLPGNVLSGLKDTAGAIGQTLEDPKLQVAIALVAGGMALGPAAAEAGVSEAALGGAVESAGGIEALASQPLYSAGGTAAGGTAAGVGSNALTGANALSGSIDPYLIGGSSLLNAYTSGEAADAASEASQAATDAIVGENRRQFDLTRADTAPYREAGVNALSNLSGRLEAEPQDKFEFNLSADPGYNFARDEATRTINRDFAGQGKTGSGNRLAALADRITGMASQYANDAYNRQKGTFNTNYGVGQDYLNRLAGLSGTGQTAVSQSGAAGQNMVGNIGNALSTGAARQTAAAGQRYGGINESIQGGIGNYLAYNQNQDMMNYLNRRQ